MRVIKLTKNNCQPLSINYFKKDSKNNRVLIIAGGSGDNRNSFNNLANQLFKQGLNYDIVSFSFRGEDSKKNFLVKQQYFDLKDLTEHLISKKNKRKINIACTSMGAISTTFVAVDKKFNNFIEQIIFIDPADYSSLNKTESKLKTWSGVDKFQPQSAVLSKKIKNISSGAKVHVVNFLLRNYGTLGYAPINSRGNDNSSLFSRLNNDMAKAFYKNTPGKNKGKYIENKKLPHAFNRDGNTKKNVLRLAKLIFKILDKPSS